MTKKFALNLSGVVFLNSFTVFPEYFISTCVIYILIVSSLITYSTYGLIIQNSLSNCIGLVLLMSCYLLFNDDYIALNFLSFHNSIISDQLAFITKFVICIFSSLYFFFISNILKEQNIISFEYLIVLLFAVIGLIVLCSSNDLISSYLAIELISLSSYILASFKKSSSYSVEAGLKYFVTGAISSALLLLGISLIYFFTGSVNMKDFYDLFSQNTFMPSLQTVWQSYHVYKTPEYSYYMLDESSYLALVTYFYYHYIFFQSLNPFALIVANFNFLEFGLLLILFSLFIKLALAPFHLWSLDVYEGSPSSSSFFFAAITKLSIFVFLIRFCYSGFFELYYSWQLYALIVGVLSILIGSVGGLKQKRIKTLLAYSSTSHMGYALLAFSTAHLFGIQMLLFYLIIYMISGLCTWYIFLILKPKTKTYYKKFNKELADFALLKKSNFALAMALSLTMFSMAGIPPLIGFFAKLGVFLSLIKNGYHSVEFYSVALISSLCSVISTFYYIRIVKVLNFENLTVGKLYYPIKTSTTIFLGILLFLLLFLFVNPTILYLTTYKVGFLFLAPVTTY